MITARRTLLVPMAALLIQITAAVPAYSQEPAEAAKPDVTIEVDGLACPFCAYGIEKKLGEVAGVENVKVKIEEGEVELTLEDDAKVTEDRIRKAVSDAGFSVRSITWKDEAQSSGA